MVRIDRVSNDDVVVYVERDAGLQVIAGLAGKPRSGSRHLSADFIFSLQMSVSVSLLK